MGDLRICTEIPLKGEEHIHGYIHSSSHTDDHFQRLQAAFQTQKLWPVTTKELTIQFVDPAKYSVGGMLYPNATPPQWTRYPNMETVRDEDGNIVHLDPLEKVLNGSTDYKEAVKRVYMERYQPIIPFKLRFVDQGGDVRISFVGGVGSWSLVGTDCMRTPANEATLNYGWLDVATIMHEFGHVLGMIHEHQNPRGMSIDWNEQKVYEYYERTQGWDEQTVYSNIIMRYSKDQINGSEFDPDSIMLYFFPSFLTVNGKGSHENARLSITDVTWVEKIYTGGVESPEDFYDKIYGGGKPTNGDSGGGKPDKPELPVFGGDLTSVIGNLLNPSSSSQSALIIVVSIFVSVIVLLLVWALFFKKK